MKTEVATQSETRERGQSRAGVFAELFKARLTSLVLLTTLAGFYLGSRGMVDLVLLTHALLGTGLLAAGAAALNQLLEREHDARMKRTASRPLPAGLLTPETALIAGGICSVVGLLELAWFVNLLTSLLGALTLLTYLFVYTPLKRITSLNTLVGAIPGALPPLMGWTAVRGEITIEGWCLFAILFFWQMPHFLAIAWLYREDYQKAGFVMLPRVDPEGARTGSSSVSHALALMPFTLCPFLFGMSGRFYLIGALILGVLFLRAAWRFSRELSAVRARGLFLVSILYLPLLLGLMVADKLKY